MCIFLISKYIFKSFFLLNQVAQLSYWLRNYFNADEGLRAPCSDVCSDYEHTKMRETNLIREGATAKEWYIEEGKSQAGNKVN